MNKEELNDNQEQMNHSHLSAEVVDQLADELVQEYGNPSFREWYCSLIWQYGIERVLYWRKKAASGDKPARLFSYFAKQSASTKFTFTGALTAENAEMVSIEDEYEGLSDTQRRALGFRINGQRRNNGLEEL